MRGTSPLLVPILAVTLLGERLPAAGWVAVALIVAGIALTGGIRWKSYVKANGRPLVLALAVGVMISVYTIVDKAALTYVPAITLNQTGNFANLLALSGFVAGTGAIGKEWRINRFTILLGGILAPGGYILFLKALELAPVAQLAPMREIGAVIGTILGILVLKETQGKARIAASVLIAAGVMALAWFG